MNSIYTAEDDVKKVKETINRFYSAYYQGDLLALYDCMDSYFQRRVHFKYFLIHERYQQNLGVLLEITAVEINTAHKAAAAEILLKYMGRDIRKSIALYKEPGGWRLEGDIFPEL